MVETYVTPETLKAGAVEIVAPLLKAYWKTIGSDKVPDDKTILSQSKLLLKGEAIDVGNGSKLTLATLTNNKDKLNQIGVNIDGLEIVTNQDLAKKTSAAINTGIEKSQGSWLEKIGDYIMGFLAWLGSGFEGGFGGLMERIGERASSRAASYVAEEIKANPDLKPVASNPQLMGKIQQTVHDKGMEYAKTGVIKQESEQELDARVLSVLAVTKAQEKLITPYAIKGAITSTIREQVTATFDKNAELNKGNTKAQEQAQKNAEALANALFDKNNATPDNQAAIQKAIAEVFIEVSTNKQPDISQMPPDEVREVLRPKLITAILDAQVKDYQSSGGASMSFKALYNKNRSTIQGVGLSNADGVAAKVVNGATIAGFGQEGLLDQIPDVQLSELSRINGLAQKNFTLPLEDMLAQINPDKLKTLAGNFKGSFPVEEAPNGFNKNPPATHIAATAPSQQVVTGRSTA